LVVSRAVADLTVLTELSLPFVKVGGLFISYKGDNKEEINSSLFAVKELGGKLIEVIYLTLPNENSKRSLVVVEKINRTSSLYPRTYDKILKKPLKIKEK
jgi:16S rRNA (guanine527-N7)-methyltransferase